MYKILQIRYILAISIIMLCTTCNRKTYFHFNESRHNLNKDKLVKTSVKNEDKTLIRKTTKLSEPSISEVKKAINKKEKPIPVSIKTDLISDSISSGNNELILNGPYIVPDVTTKETDDRELEKLGLFSAILG